MLQNTLTRLTQLKQARLIYQDIIFTPQQIANRAINLIGSIKKSYDLSKPIALYLPNSPELLCWQIACFYLGVVIVPIIFEHDSKYVEKVLALTQPEVLLTTTEKQKQFSSTSCKIHTVDDRFDAIKAGVSANISVPSSEISADKMAMIIFSSGSTGDVKGVMHTYQSAFGFIQLLKDVLDANQKITYLVAQPMGHIGGISTTLLALLNDGAAILLENFVVDQYLQMMEHYEPTHINLHTPLFYDLINAPRIKKKSFSHIVSCFAGGDDIPRELPAQFTEKTGAPMRIGYGMTEVGIVVANKKPYGKYAGTSGQKVNQTQIELRDEQNNIVKEGEIGEIWVKSPACCLGYWNAAELDSKTLVDGWFRTGDLARVDEDGFYWYQGRASDVIHRGKRAIYPKTIEQALFDYSGVKAAAVIGMLDKQEGEVPVAFVELKNSVNKKIEHAQISDYLVKHLLPWEIPKLLRILDKMPLNTTGKIDRIALKKLLPPSK